MWQEKVLAGLAVAPGLSRRQAAAMLHLRDHTRGTSVVCCKA